MYVNGRDVRYVQESATHRSQRRSSSCQRWCCLSDEWRTRTHTRSNDGSSERRARSPGHVTALNAQGRAKAAGVASIPRGGAAPLTPAPRRAVRLHRGCHRPHAAGGDPAHVAERPGAALRQAGVPEPDGLRQGPRRQGAHRGPGALRPAARRLHHPGADQRQHRHRAGHDRAPEGIPGRGRDARQRHPGAASAAGAVRRGDHRFARVTRFQRIRCHGEGSCREGLEVRDALPVRQPGQPRRPRVDDRRGDHRRLPRGRRVRRRPRHRRHAHGCRQAFASTHPDVRIYAAEPLPTGTTSRACARWTRGSSPRSSTRACWTGSSWSPTASRSPRCAS